MKKYICENWIALDAIIKHSINMKNEDNKQFHTD